MKIIDSQDLLLVVDLIRSTSYLRMSRNSHSRRWWLHFSRPSCTLLKSWLKMVSVTIDHYLVIWTHLINLQDFRICVAALPAIFIRSMRLVMRIPLHVVNLSYEVVIVKFPLKLVFCNLSHTLADCLWINTLCIVVSDIRAAFLLLLTPLNPLIDWPTSILLLMLS